MNDSSISALLALNRRFYTEFGDSFAATRRRIQPGIRRIFASLPPGGDWLDLGCGSGALAETWAACGRRGSYTGLDFSPTLLEEARRTLQGAPLPEGLTLRFLPADLSNPAWMEVLEEGATLPAFDGILAFAVLHHLPSASLRRSLLNQVRSLLKPGAKFIHSEWQFQNSPRLLARRLEWESAGLNPADLEEGDTLLDWRHSMPGKPAAGSGLRYVHLFSRQELAELADDCGFEIVEEFESDGKGGRLGLYQAWQVRTT